MTPSPPKTSPEGNPERLRATLATRSIDSLSMMNPLTYGDIIELDGPTGGDAWQVNRSSAGWCLHRLGNRSHVHPTIHDIDGMLDFICAILDCAKGGS